ncbi:hypothetical protein RJ639_047876 [Escallonia herrerae]|uniref:BHLH domain-containing protein n=1 Tax=Escallonia herrerae TaxID=1293975 RepID=A0AA88W6L8_9ASTE|nr:hypothetical protein RJ639_047876 [Escallonia herrerae]
MESVGVFVNEEWDSLSKMFSSDEVVFLNENLSFGTPATFWPSDHEAADANLAGVDDPNVFYSSINTLNHNLYYHFSQESSNSSGSNNSVHEHYQFCDDSNILIPLTNNFSDESIANCAMDDEINNSLGQVFPDNVMEDILCLKEEEMGPGNVEINADSLSVATADHASKEVKHKRRCQLPELHEAAEDKIVSELSGNPKKRSRVSRDAQKNKKNVQPKKNEKHAQNGSNGEETNNAGLNGHGSTCYSSEDDSNASQELNGGATSDSKGSAALNSNGKTRASRGSATDPQSLYARVGNLPCTIVSFLTFSSSMVLFVNGVSFYSSNLQKRRERINERLRILQNIVPNGTKVDISTMLEEAVHYVKFLQLQIKLLSSDDMWMYAPIAYNGMDMGLYQKISSTQ